MANLNMTKLPHLPWPVWVGASLLLHAGALAIGLPTILRVDPPASSSIDIPVTLVDEGATSAAAPEPSSLVPQVLEDSAQQPRPLGGQNPTVEPRLSNQAVALQESPKESAPQKPETAVPINRTPSEKPVSKPTNEVAPPDNLDIPNETIVETPPTSDKPASAEEETQNSESEVGAISISIVDTSTVPPGTPGDWPDKLPILQSTSTLSLINHPCNDAVPASEVTLGVLIDTDGSVAQVFAPSSGDAIANQTASCLLTHALDANPTAIRFNPAFTGQQAIITDRVQLTLRFSAS